MNATTTAPSCCYGVGCPVHASCARYAAIDGYAEQQRPIATCANHGARPLFLAVVATTTAPATAKALIDKGSAMNEESQDTAAVAAPAAPPAIGDAIEGGFFAGRIRIGEAIFGLVVAPKAKGELIGPWGPRTGTVGADSFSDGLANTLAMAAAGLPLAAQVIELEIEGFADWYIPARDELELLYRAFKPTTAANGGTRSGENPSAVPPTHAYQPLSPAATALPDFQPEATQAMDQCWHWSSTEHSPTNAWGADFCNGNQDPCAKGERYAVVRAVRRFAIQ